MAEKQDSLAKNGQVGGHCAQHQIVITIKEKITIYHFSVSLKMQAGEIH